MHKRRQFKIGCKKKFDHNMKTVLTVFFLSNKVKCRTMFKCNEKMIFFLNCFSLIWGNSLGA